MAEWVYRVWIGMGSKNYLFLFLSCLGLASFCQAEPLNTVFNPFTGKPDYITRIDSNTVTGTGACTSTSNSNGTVSFTCVGGGGGSSSLQTTQSGVQITSPTSSLNFTGPPFSLTAIGTTAQITLNPSSVTLLGLPPFPSSDITLISSGIAFGSATNTITQDTNTFRWDNTAKNLYLQTSQFNQAIILDTKSGGLNQSDAIKFMDVGATVGYFGYWNNNSLGMNFSDANHNEFASFDPVSQNVIFNNGLTVATETITSITSLPVQANASHQLIGSQISLSSAVTGTLPDTNLSSNVGFLKSTQTWTGQNNWTTPLPSSFTYNVAAGSLTLTGIGNFTFTNPPDGLTYQVVGSSMNVTPGHYAEFAASNTIIDGGLVGVLNATQTWTGASTFVSSVTITPNAVNQYALWVATAPPGTVGISTYVYVSTGGTNAAAIVSINNSTNSTIPVMTMTGQEELVMNDYGLQNAMQINEKGSVSTSFTTGGAFNINMDTITHGPGMGSGMVIYSPDNAPIDNLVNLRTDSPAYSQNMLFISGNGSSHLLSINNTSTGTASSAANIVSSNPNLSALQVSGQEVGFGTAKMTHTGTGTDANSAVLSLQISGAGTAAQGIFVTAPTGTTGPMMQLKNNTLVHTLDVFDTNGSLGVSVSTVGAVYEAMFSTTINAPGLPLQDSQSIAISTNGEIVVAGSSGTSGQFLSSQGPGLPVKWATAAGSGGSSSLGVNQNAVSITSPTAALNFIAPPFIVTSVGGGTTAQINLDASSVTLQGNNLSATYLTNSSATATYGQLKATQTWTGQNSWTTPLPSSFTYAVNIGSVTGAGLGTCGDATHALAYTSTNTFACQSITGSGGAPANPTNSIQFNNAGSFGGSGGFSEWTSSVTNTQSQGMAVSYVITAGSGVFTNPLNSNTTAMNIINNDTVGQEDALVVTNAGIQNAVQVIQTGQVSKSFINGGAVNLVNGTDPTNPTGHGALLVLYSSDTAPSDNMVNIRQDAVAFSSNVVYISGISSSPLVSINFAGIEGDGAKGGAMNIASSNPNYSAVSISGTEGAPDGFGTVKISHTAPAVNDANASALSIDLLGTGTAAQGIFLKSSASGGTTGKLVNIRNPNTERFVIRQGGDVNITPSTTTAAWDLFLSTTPGLTQDNVTLAISTNAEISLNGSVGTSGQLLSSQGPGLPVKWTAASGGGGSSTLGISSGSATVSVVISSPTSNVVFDSNTFVASLQGTTTSFIQINSSSVTLQGQNVLKPASLSATQPILYNSGTGVFSATLISATTGFTGTLQAAQFPALTGDITTSAGSLATTAAGLQNNITTFGSSITFKSETLHKSTATFVSDKTAIYDIFVGSNSAGIPGTTALLSVSTQGPVAINGPGGLALTFGVNASTFVGGGSGLTSLTGSNIATGIASTVLPSTVAYTTISNTFTSSQTVTSSMSITGAGGLNVTFGVSANTGTFSSLSSGNCVQAGTGGLLTTVAGACASTSGFASLTATQTFTGGNTFSSIADSTFTYGINIGSVTGAGLAACGSASTAEGYTSTGTFACTTITAAGIGALTGNQTITLSGQASGSGATSIVTTLNPISVSTGILTPAVFTSSVTDTSSMTISGAGGETVTFGISASTMIISSNTILPGATFYPAGPIHVSSITVDSKNSFVANGGVYFSTGQTGVVNANYTADANDNIILASATPSGITVTLPFSTNTVGHVIEIAKVDNDTYPVKIATNFPDLIEGGTTFINLNGYMQKAELASYGFINSSGAWNEHGGGVQYTPLVVQPAPGAIASSGPLGISSSTYCMGVFVPSPVFIKSLDYSVQQQAGNIDIGVYDSTGTKIRTSGNTAMGSAGTVAVSFTPFIGLARGNYFFCMWESAGSNGTVPGNVGRYSTYNNTPGCGGPLTIANSTSLPSNIGFPMTKGNQCFQIWGEVSGGSPM